MTDIVKRKFSTFGTIAERITDNTYGVIIRGGQRIEATYHRNQSMNNFDAGNQVFLERMPGSALWMITSYAFGNPSDPPCMGWFRVSDPVWGMINGPGRILPS